jgi:hypothetical protein
MADEDKTVENPSATRIAKKTADSKKKGAAKKTKAGKAAKKVAAGKAPASAPKASEAQPASPPTGAPAGSGGILPSSQPASPEPAATRPSVGRETDTESMRSGLLALWGPATMLVFVVLIFRFMGDDESSRRGVAGDQARAVLSAEPESGAAVSQGASPEDAVEKAVTAVAAEQVQGGGLEFAEPAAPAVGESAGAGSLTRGQAAAPAFPNTPPETAGSQAELVAKALQSATSDKIMAAIAAAQSPAGPTPEPEATAYAPAPGMAQNPWAPSGAGGWERGAVEPPPPTGQQTWAAAPPAYPPQGVYPPQAYPQYGWQPTPTLGGPPSPYQRPAYAAAPPAGAYQQIPPGAYPQPYYGPQPAAPYGSAQGYPPPGY